MNSYGIKVNFLTWVKKYLHERKQKLVIRDSSSSLSNVSAGVPQALCLNPYYSYLYK